MALDAACGNGFDIRNMSVLVQGRELTATLADFLDIDAVVVGLCCHGELGEHVVAWVQWPRQKAASRTNQNPN